MPASSGWRRPTRSVHLRETGAGLDAALAGVDAVIDVTSVASISAARSVEFFAAASASLLSAEARQRVGHHVALSIVGIDAVPFGYYAGKIAQERMVTDAVVPHSILRATKSTSSPASCCRRPPSARSRSCPPAWCVPLRRARSPFVIRA